MSSGVLYIAAFADLRVVAEHFPITVAGDLARVASLSLEILPQLQPRLDGSRSGSVLKTNKYVFTAQKESDIVFLCAEDSSSSICGVHSEAVLRACCLHYKEQIKSQGRSYGSKARDLMFILRYCCNEIQPPKISATTSSPITPTTTGETDDDSALRLQIGRVEGEVASVRDYLAASVIGNWRITR
eukprot:Protomagalhaensia_sp_Gyna_25__2046@NODE_20_length_7955_cov_303_925088_g13_i0_p6_GENE_NODE_20_length_7955_cov_303_925088_g13_i0NODE_20_length_7955_cov_303_925088_g13_i0_p6_ORF_typecomplete_len186_score12_09_NODE_20_length_7955_cov_303_925088_g13_i014972054